MFNHLRKAVVAALAAGALMLAGGAAHATTAPDSIVDDSKAPGAIHLVKYDDGSGAGTAATGTKLDKDPAGAKAIDGIEFKLTKITEFTKDGHKVKINIKDNGQIADLGKLDAAKILAPTTAAEYTLDTSGAKTAKTANGGKIEFAELDLGVYLLQETNSTAKDGKTYKAAAPSLIFLPTTDPTTQNKWITDLTTGKYAVWVYPKNSLEENIKTADDTNKQVGDQVTYTISASVPAVQKLVKPIDGRNWNLNDFAIWDNLDEKLAFPKVEGVNTLKVEVDESTGKKLLTPDVDYKVTIYTDGGKETGQKVVAALTATGLEKVAVAKNGLSTAKVHMTFTPTVKASGIAPNQAVIFKNTGDGAGSIKPETPGENPPEGQGSKTNVVVSAWGKIAINKKDDKGAALKGAEFQVFGVTGGLFDPTDNEGQGKNANVKIHWEKPIAVNGKSTFATEGEQGTVTIDGLHANNLVNSGANVNEPQYSSYVLVETKAPEKYELNKAPIPFKIEAAKVETITKTESWKSDAQGNVVPGSADFKVTVEEKETDVSNAAVQTLHRTVDVVNIPAKPKLPMTGGAGVALFGILGLAIIGGGVYAAKRNTKKA
ncbi:hypothetical protein CQ11_08240 [Trueperella pyogenes]|uniref:SpaH/EbpB family LPXTG-anchored major pilin n=1 Tax=Trueperella pyogenes TaxID=1661 RepID=UPI00043AFA01|nr:SpaH/EbpB family LPXTG-anchored major pilin [Trueperella pyogenes]AHU90586.1 hypothetical protein CQ11_08240 [Trueperella pyogenes]